MANGLGIAAGLTGFAEGFAKSITRRKELESQHRNKAENFVTQQLIKGALEDPQSVVESPEIMGDLEKRLGPNGHVFTQFLQHHATRVSEDQNAASFLAPHPTATPALSASPESQIIAGQGTVLAPPAEAPAFTPPTFGEAPASMVEQPEAAIPPPQPQSRASQLQARLQPGQTYARTFKKTGEKVTLTGGKGQEIGVYQEWQGLMANGVGAQESALTATQNAIARGMQPPKDLMDLAMAPAKADIAAQADAAKEKARRAVGISQPKNAEEFRAAAASGVVPGGYVIGRGLQDKDLDAAKSQSLLIQTLPDGTKIAVPKDYASISGLPTVNPQSLIDEANARKIAAKTTTQTQNAKIIRGVLENARPGYALLLPAPKTLAGLGARGIQGYTTQVGKLALLRSQGNDAAIGLRGLKTSGTPYVKALGDVGAITKNDREAFEDIVGRVAAGRASQEEALAVDAWLSDLLDALDRGAGKDETTKLNISDYKAQAAKGAGLPAPTPPQGAGTTTSGSTTTTTLPFGAHVVEE